MFNLKYPNLIELFIYDGERRVFRDCEACLQLKKNVIKSTQL